MNRSLVLFCLLFQFSSNCFSQVAENSDELYRIKAGDTIGSILFSLEISPLWGPKGNVKKTIELNPGLIDSSGRFVYPNSFIKLPKKIQRNIANVQPPLVIESQEGASPIEAPSADSFFSDAQVIMGFHYLELNSTEKADGSKAKLETELIPSVLLSWNVKWSSYTQTLFNVGIAKTTFKGVTEKEIENTSAHYGQFGIAQYFKFENGWQILGAFEQKQMPYLRALSATKLKIESPWMKAFSLSVQKSILKKSNGEMSVGFTPYYILGKEMQDFKIHNGQGAKVHLDVVQNFKKFDLKATVFSEYGQQDSSITRQSWQSNGISLGITIPLGKEP